MSEFIPVPSPGAALKIAAALLNGPTEYLSLLLPQLAPTNAARQPQATNQPTHLEPGNTTRKPE